MKKLELIRNIMDVKVDTSKEINHYIIQGMYNEIQEDGFAEIVFKTINEFDYTWDEIEKKGGISQVNKELRERYKIEKW